MSGKMLLVLFGFLFFSLVVLGIEPNQASFLPLSYIPSPHIYF
jgi:hypothetical protein